MNNAVPAVTIRAIVQGMTLVGLDVEQVRREAGLPANLGDLPRLAPERVLQTLWASAFSQAQREELAVEVGLVLPLGVFGPMDYLAASADTVGGAFESLANHFVSVAAARSIEVEERDGEYRVGFLHHEEHDLGVCGDDFTIGVMVNRFRGLAESFPLVAVELTRAVPAQPQRFAELLGAPISFGHVVSTLRFAAAMREVPLKTRDPLLRQALESMASQLSLGRSAPPLEMAIRSRLRDLLATSRADAPHLARSLGMSERSLHRRLAEIGQTYQGVVDAFRRGEAERLLSTRDMGMTEIALFLGFADQSAFSRAFKRWTRMSPTQWVARGAT